jgi:hypothetical protein
MPTASNPNARASCLMAPDKVMDRMTYCCGEQSKRMLNLAEQCSDRQRPQNPVMVLFQSVRVSSNRHMTRPPREIVIHAR